MTNNVLTGPDLMDDHINDSLNKHTFEVLQQWLSSIMMVKSRFFKPINTPEGACIFRGNPQE